MCQSRRFCSLAAGLAVLAAGCIPSTDEVQQPDENLALTPIEQQPTAQPPDGTMPVIPEGAMTFTSDGLLADWNALAEDPIANLGNPQVVQIGVMMHTMGPEQLEPFFAVLADPDAAPEKKVLVVATLQNVADASMTEKLTPLTSEEHDITTRSAAAQLISLAQDPNAKDLLQELSKDEHERIRLAALQGLVLLSDTNATDQLRAMFFEEGVETPTKDRIVQTLARFPQPESLPVYRSAAIDPLLEPASRFYAVVGLGEVGDESDVALLDQAAEMPGDEEFTNMVTIARNKLTTPTPDLVPANPESETAESPDSSNEAP